MEERKVVELIFVKLLGKLKHIDSADLVGE